ncbi:hypothetical protein Tco_1364235, partial [Tanacetum coccineum]
KKDYHISHASGSGDGTDFESGVPDEQHRKTSSTDEGTEEDNDDENDFEDESDNGNNDDNDDDDDGDNDANDDDNQEDDDKNDDEEETDSDRTKSDRIKISALNQSTIEYYEEEEEKVVDEVTKELYKDMNVNLGNEDVDMTVADQGGTGQQNVSQESGFEQVEEDAHVTLTPVLNTQKTDEPVQSSSVSSDFTSKLLNLENPSLADNEIASLMDTTVRHEEPESQTSSLYTIPIMTVPKITSVFTTTIPPPPPFFNPFPSQATPTLTPTTSEATTSFLSLPDFLFVFKFNDRVTNLEKDISEIKQVDQYAQALSSIPAIVDRYLDNKLREAIQKAILAYNLDLRAILKEEVNTQLPQILPQAISDFATPVIEKNVIESLEAAVLARSSSQPKSTYEAAASLFEFKLTKILIDKMEKNKSYDKADYKRELYDVLVKSYQTEKDLFDTYGEVFTLKRTESSRDSRSKERKSSSSSKDASHSQHNPSGKSAHTEEPSHTVDDSGVQHNQEIDTSNNDEQPADKETWINQVAHAKEPTTLFDELINTPIDFSAFVLNWLNIKDLTQAILVGPEFDLLKGTCKSLTELEYHLEECSKATTKRLNWHNPEGNPYPFDLKYLKGGSLSRQYLTSITKTKASNYEIKWIEDLVSNLWSPVKVVYDKHTYLGTSHWVTKLKIMKKCDYGHLEEIEVRREDQQLHKFREGDFLRLCLQDIKDMLLLLIQQKLTNLIIDERYDLNVALRKFTKRIVIQRHMKDLQLGVESYQKKLNLTKPDTSRSNHMNRTAYTAYSGPKGVIYKDQNNRNILMRADELHKFSDDTLNNVRTALHDIASGMMRIWKAFGGNTLDLGSFREETNETTDLHHLSRLCSQRLETASQDTSDAITIHPTTVSQHLMTASSRTTHPRI